MFLVNPSRKLVLAALIVTIPVTIVLNLVFAGTPYLILTSVIIIGSFLVVAVPTIARNGWRLDEPLVQIRGRAVGWLGAVLGVAPGPPPVCGVAQPGRGTVGTAPPEVTRRAWPAPSE